MTMNKEEDDNDEGDPVHGDDHGIIGVRWFRFRLGYRPYLGVARAAGSLFARRDSGRNSRKVGVPPGSASFSESSPPTSRHEPFGS